jgi:next-to-BRCA1 protein 1
MARFVTDVTIPDGTKVKTGTKFVKIWLLRNDGKAAWPVGSRLMPVGGDNMVSGEAASDGVLVVPASREVLPGQEVEVSMELTAPAKPGRYVGHFRMQIGDQRFGHRVWADVVVEQPEQLPEQLPAQEEPKMDISQDVVLAVSAKLRDIQAHRSEATEAESPSSPSFVMVPMPETLLAMPEVDSAAPVAVAAPPLNSAPPAYVHTLSPPVENTPALPAPPAPPAPHTPVPAPSLPDSVTVTPVVAPVAAADLIDAAVHGQNNTKFQDQLNQLADMGFFDKKLLTEMLEAEMGDIQRVVERLLL